MKPPPRHSLPYGPSVVLRLLAYGEHVFYGKARLMGKGPESNQRGLLLTTDDTRFRNRGRAAKDAAQVHLREIRGGGDNLLLAGGQEKESVF